MGSNSDGQLGVGRNPEWTSVPIQIHGTSMIIMMMTMTMTMTSVPIQIHGICFNDDNYNDQCAHTVTWYINDDSDDLAYKS